MRLLFVTLVLIGCLRDADASDAQEIRFCPADVARTYPLDSRARVQSLLLPHIAVINHADAPFTVNAIHLELIKGGQLLDTRHLNAADVQRLAGNSAEIEALAREASFMFCGTELIAPGIKLAGPVLHANEGLVVTNEVFAFNRERDTLRVRVEGTVAGKGAELSATLPVTSKISKTDWLFPVRGVSYVGWGASLHTAHRWVLPEAYALDIARLGGSGLTYRGEGTRFSDYYAYGTEIYAAAAGKVIESVSDVSEDATLLQRPNETTEAYFARVHENQAKLMESQNGPMGNHVIIDHGNHEYSLYAHMQPGSVRVRAGESVAAGALLGRLGSSGNSTEPHLHFQLCAGSSALQCNGMPVSFSNIRVLWAERDRALQSGDIVIAK
ncbi:M23 family metallopeptidase [Peristeroidobacter soli]|uniref:M23 family metallopeptidase n=1 Tax=Peristeroidobacter soli TaxID=2497877 RepID=UPI00101D4F9A|nr:M23 family metallopeptidase [Peristeroidobacter soli]